MPFTIKKEEWINNLRGISIIMIVVSHLFNSSLPALKQLHWIDWWLINFFCSINRFCVPIFLMASGAMLLSRENKAVSFYQKRWKKVGIPFLFWSTIYTILYFALALYRHEIDGIEQIFEFIFNSYVFGAAYHLWYFYLLFALYLVIPWVGQWITNSKTFELIYLGLWIVSIFGAQFSDWMPFYYMRWLLGYFGFMVFGYFLSRLEIGERWQKAIALFLFILGTGITMWGGYHSVSTQSVDYFEWYYRINFNVVVMASGLFLWFRFTPTRTQLFQKLAVNGFGIYLCHVLVIMFVNLWLPEYLPFARILGLCLRATLVLFFSYYLIEWLKKIPALKGWLM